MFLKNFWGAPLAGDTKKVPKNRQKCMEKNKKRFTLNSATPCSIKGGRSYPMFKTGHTNLAVFGRFGGFFWS